MHISLQPDYYLNSDFRLEPPDLVFEFGDDVLVLRHLVGDIQDISLYLQEHAYASVMPMCYCSILK